MAKISYGPKDAADYYTNHGIHLGENWYTLNPSANYSLLTFADHFESLFPPSSPREPSYNGDFAPLPPP